MDGTIRNLDPALYRAVKARAALTGATIGETVNAALRAYLARPAREPGAGSLRDIGSEAYPEGNERLSEDVDAVVYGA